MLDFLPRFAEGLVSSIADLLPLLTTALPPRAAAPRLAPHDPSTLALAIVGLVTLAVYYAASGWRRSRREESRSCRAQNDASHPRPAVDQTEKPTRDAA